MKFILILSALAVVGCTSPYAGVRGAVVPTIQGGEETGSVQNSSNGLGFTYGLTAGVGLSNKLGVQVDPSYRTASLTQEVEYPFETGGTQYLVNAQAVTGAMLMEVPIILTTRRTINDRFRTMFGLGPHFAFRTSTSGEITGTATIVSGEQAGTTAPLTPVSVSAGSDDSILFGISLMAACDMVISGPLAVRGELRFQHDFLNDQMSAYEFAGYNGPVITAEYPPTRLSVGIAILFGTNESR
jgi:hypothetical protein